MQTHGGAPAATAIESHERVFRAELKVDWDKDGRYTHPLSDLSPFVSSATTDRSLRGSAPEEVLLIEGASAAELVVTLHGDYQGLSFAGLFSPYQQRSPFFQTNIIGAEITYRLGVETVAGVVWYPQFVGNIRTITPDRADGTVEITALDRVEKLRRPVQFPPWAISEFHLSRGVIQAQLCQTQWVIDHCLRLCDTSPTPHRLIQEEETDHTPEDLAQWASRFWLSGTGSYLPTYGYPDATQEFPVTETTGTPMFSRFGPIHPDAPNPSDHPLTLAALGDEPGSMLRYWVSNRDALFSSLSTHYMGFTLVTRGPRAAYYRSASAQEVMTVRINGFVVIKIKVEDGEIWTERLDEDGGTLFPSSRIPVPDGDYVDVSVVWNVDFTAGIQYFLQVGSDDTGLQTVAPPPDLNPPRDPNAGLMQLWHRVSLGDVYYYSEGFIGFAGTSLVPRRPTRYAAVLDPGLNRFSFLPTRSSNDAWEIITAVAGSEFGSVFWDETGVFRFWNYQRILALQDTVVRTLTLDDVSGMKITNSLDSVRNIWSIEVKQKRAVPGKVYSARSQDQYYTERGISRFPVWVDDVLAPIPSLIPRYVSAAGNPFWPQWNNDVQHGYVVQWFKNGVWAEDNTRQGIDVSAYFDWQGYLVIRLQNGWPEPARLLRDNGQPALAVGGTRILDAIPLTFSHKDQGSIGEYSGRNLSLSGDWYQDLYNSAAMVDELLPRTARPSPTTDAITIAGDPRLQLGDCITINDDDGFGSSAPLQIYGIRREFSRDGGLADTLTVELTRRRKVFENATNVNIPDSAPAVTSAITVAGIPGNASSALKVGVDIKHTYRGDLEIDLIAPDGTTFRLKNSESTDSDDNVITTYTVNASSSPATGIWQLRVRDVFQADTGFIDSWRLTFFI